MSWKDAASLPASVACLEPSSSNGVIVVGIPPEFSQEGKNHCPSCISGESWVVLKARHSSRHRTSWFSPRPSVLGNVA